MAQAPRREPGPDRIEQIFRAVREAARYEALVGVPASTAGRNDGEMSNAVLAYIHDKGSPAANIPARPFMETGVESVRGKIEEVLQKAVADALDTGDTGLIMRGLELAGLVGANGIQQKIVDGPFVPLKPATIRRKGSSKPLIDTGQLRQSITYVVRPR